MNGTDFLLDTNVVIGLLKGQPEAIALADQAGLTPDKAVVSQITRMELLGFPRLTDEEERAIHAFLSVCRVRLLDERIEQEAIRLRRTGTFKLPDAIVAATAICEGLRLLTLDQAMVKGMRGLG